MIWKLEGAFRASEALRVVQRFDPLGAATRIPSSVLSIPYGVRLYSDCSEDVTPKHKKFDITRLRVGRTGCPFSNEATFCEPPGQSDLHSL